MAAIVALRGLSEDVRGRVPEDAFPWGQSEYEGSQGAYWWSTYLLDVQSRAALMTQTPRGDVPDPTAHHSPGPTVSNTHTSGTGLGTRGETGIARTA